MSDLSAFPITQRWPAKHPDRLQLYSLPTPNGVKLSIALEEIGLPYEVHLIDILKNKAARIRIGDPQDQATEMGPLATQRQYEHIRETLVRSVAAGATIIHGGDRPAGLPEGWYFEPTIVAAAGNKVPCVAEELFGPVLSVVAFDD